MPLSTLNVIEDALGELGVKDPNETLSAADAATGLRKLNSLLDLWDAKRWAVYADVFSTFTLTPSLAPHTIGPAPATWVMPARPVSIEGAGIETSPGSGITMPITLRDAAWWEGVSMQGLSAVTLSLYYNPTWPLGTLNFWPVPSSALAVTLMTRAVLGSLALATTFSLPQGYQSALTLSLAEECAAAFGTQPKASTIVLAQQARATVFGNNVKPPRISTADSGMPGSGGGMWNYLTGTFR